jgi:hypothetical protein
MGPALLATSTPVQSFSQPDPACDPEFANLFSAGGFRLGAARGCASCRVVEAIMPATGFRPAGGKDGGSTDEQMAQLHPRAREAGGALLFLRKCKDNQART